MSLRQPTPADQVFGFYWRAMCGEQQAVIEQDPQAGWYQIRLAKRGPWVPVRIWLEQETGDDGELLGPEILKCTVDGEEKDPRDVWQWCCTRPIAEHEFRYLSALRSWQKVNEPEAWDPYRQVDMTETPIEG
jgi:hypothetical protein